MPVVKRTLNFYWSQLTNETYHYLNKATTTTISTSNISFTRTEGVITAEGVITGND
jgi:hypothetical protein